MALDIKALINNQSIPLARNLNTGKYEEIVIAPDVLESTDYAISLTAVDDAGNSSSYTTVPLTVDAIWITPKTDWACHYNELGQYIGDYLNKEDWRRIMGNLLYLKSLAYKMYPVFEFFDMGSTKEYADYPYANEWNAVEDNIDQLINNTYKFYAGQKRVFSDNGSFPEYNELNRIESTSLKLYEILKSQYESIKVLAFTLGGDEFGS